MSRAPQLGLFDAKPKRRKAPLVEVCEDARAVATYPVEQALAELDPAIDPARSALLSVLVERLDNLSPQFFQSDARGTLAKYSRQVPNESGCGSPDLWCGVGVSVEAHHATRPHRFMVDAYLELPDRDTRWRFCRVYKTRDEAAVWAAAFVKEGERLLARWTGGAREIETPGARQWAAAMAHVRAMPEYQKHAAAVGKRPSSDEPDRWRAWMHRRHDAEAAMRSLELQHGRAFCDAHPWTEFLEVP